MNSYSIKLRTLILAHDAEQLERFVRRTQDEELSADEVTELLTSLNFIDQNTFSRDNFVFSFSGVGGSGHYKPNISSITAVFIAALCPDLKVIKAGSRAKTGLYGSFDFLEEFGFVGNRHKNFCCFDTDASVVWKRYRSLLTCNQSIREYLDRTVVFDYPYSRYLIGVLGAKSALNLHRKHKINPPAEVSFFWAENGDIVLDEIIIGKLLVSHQQGHVTAFTIDGDATPRFPHRRAEVIEMNRALLRGDSDCAFWNESLRSSVGYCLWDCGRSADFAQGREIFDRAVRDKVVLHFLGLS